jgi:hypothetical protein
MKASPSPALGAQTSIPAFQYGWAVAVLIAVRIGLTLFGFKKLERLMPRMGAKASALSPWQISWSVKRTARYVPWASCLTQAISLQYMLGSHGEPSIICVGVKPDSRRKFTAHAWLLWDDQIIIGGDKNLGEFHIIVRLEAKTR